MSQTAAENWRAPEIYERRELSYWEDYGMASKEQSLLVVEDEPVLQGLISKTLEQYGFRVLRAADGIEALALWEQEQPDLIMLDLRLPRLDGFEVCRRVRQFSVVPIIVLTALTEDADKVTAFDLGVDDYLTKPFSVEELRARVGAVLRRSRWREQPPSPSTRRFGRLTVNFGERQLLRDEQAVCLTHTEWALFEELVTHADATLTHRMLLKRVWGDAYADESKYLRAYIGRLRRKLEDDPARPRYLLTEPGVGYRFVSQQINRARATTASTTLASALRHNRLGNLPAQMIPMIGREHDMEAVGALLRRPELRLLTFTGPPGVGKTRLGLQVASVLLDEFSHGTFFVALASISDPSLVLGTIARTLGVKEAGSQSLIERLKVHLRDKQVLLLLDNFEQVVVAASVVSELLAAAPQLKVLVTSRAALHIYGEHEFAVAPLTLPNREDVLSLDLLAQSPAVSLFMVRALAVKPDFALTQENARAVAAICARLDGLPLAIELAAAQVKLLSPQAILLRLDSRLQVLTGGARDLPVRHQTLRAAIDWSYDLLDAQDQQLFARLGVFVGGCTAEAAEAICGIERARGSSIGASVQQARIPTGRDAIFSPTLEGLASLIDKSLLRQVSDMDDPPRFVMLATICEYALERLVEHGEAEMVRRRHAEYFRALAQTAEQQLRSPKLRTWLERLESEHDNIRAALQWSLECGESELVMQLVSSLPRFWDLHSHLSEGRYWLEAALAHATGNLSPHSMAVRAKALVVAGMLALWQFDSERALSLCEESLSYYRELGDKHGIALALSNLGHVIRDQGDDERANQLYAESLALYREAEITWGIARSLHNLGLLPLKTGDYERARALFEESLELFRELGDLCGMVLGLTHLAEVARNQGDYARSSGLFEETLLLQRDMGDKEGVTCSLEGLASVAAVQGQPLRVSRLYGASQALRAAIDAPMQPYERARYQQMVAIAKVQVDAQAWEAAWDEGRMMRPEQAIAYALSQYE